MNTMLMKSPEERSSSTGNGSPKPRGAAQATKQTGPKRPKLPLRYFFTINCNLNSTQPQPIEVPGGVRVHLGYLAEGSSVTTVEKLFDSSWERKPNPRLADVSDADRKAVEALLEDKSRVGIVQLLDDLAKKYGKELSSKKLKWPGISGKVLSGGDTLLVRSDGVVVFDGRATIEEEKGFLIDVCASGVVDLRNAVPAGRSGQEAFEAYCAGGDSNAATTGSIPVTLSIRFEASQGAGAAAEFAAKRYVLNSLNHWKFESLVRGQFVGIGKVHVKPGRYWPAEKLELDVYRLGSLP